MANHDRNVKANTISHSLTNPPSILSLPRSKTNANFQNNNDNNNKPMPTSTSDNYLHPTPPPPKASLPPSHPSRIRPFILRSTSPKALHVSKAEVTTKMRGTRSNWELQQANLVQEGIEPLNKSKRISTSIGKKVKAAGGSLLARSGRNPAEASSSLFSIYKGESLPDKRNPTSSEIHGRVMAVEEQKARMKHAVLERKRSEQLLAGGDAIDQGGRRKWLMGFGKARSGSVTKSESREEGAIPPITSLSTAEGQVKNVRQRVSLGDISNRHAPQSSTTHRTSPEISTQSSIVQPNLRLSSLPAIPPTSPAPIPTVPSNLVTSSPPLVALDINPQKTPPRHVLRPSASAASLTTPGENQRGTNAGKYAGRGGGMSGGIGALGLGGARRQASCLGLVERNRLAARAGEEQGGSGYSSMQDMLEFSGFRDCRIVTPTAIRRPASDPTLLAALGEGKSDQIPLQPISPTLRAKTSLLSIGNLLHLWQTNPLTEPSDLELDADDLESIGGSDHTIREAIRGRATEWRDRVALERELSLLIPTYPHSRPLSTSPTGHYLHCPTLSQQHTQLEPSIESTYVAPIRRGSQSPSGSCSPSNLTLELSTRSEGLQIIAAGGLKGRRNSFQTPSKASAPTMAISNQVGIGSSDPVSDESDDDASATRRRKPDRKGRIASRNTTAVDGLKRFAEEASGTTQGKPSKKALRHASSTPNISTRARSSITPPPLPTTSTYQSFAFDVEPPSFDDEDAIVGSRREYDGEDDEDFLPAKNGWTSSLIGLPHTLRTRASSAVMGLSRGLGPALGFGLGGGTASIGVGNAVATSKYLGIPPALLRKAVSSSVLRPVLTKDEGQWTYDQQ